MFPRPGGRKSFLYPESTWPSSSCSSLFSSSSSSSSSSRSFVDANISSAYTALVDSIPSASGLVSACRKRKLSEREKARKVEIKKETHDGVTCLSLPANQPTSLPVNSQTGELKRKMVEMERAQEQLWMNNKKRARLTEPVCSQAMNMFLNIRTATQTVQLAHRYSRISQLVCLKRGGGL